MDLSKTAHVAITIDDVATLQEMLVGLRVVEAADKGPDGGDGGGDGLDHGGAALGGSHLVCVVPENFFRHGD